MHQMNNGSKVFLLIACLCMMVSCQENAEQTPENNEEKDLQLFELKKAEQTGLNFNLRGEKLLKGDNTGIASNISAIAVGDINNDGLPDIFVSGGVAPSALFLNEGNLKFRDITREAGIVDHGEGMADNEGVNFVDINGDGLLDIYILKTGIRGNFTKNEFTDFGANLLYINQGDTTFREEAAKYGLDLIGLSHTANFFDYDGDGDLDVYMIYTAEPGAAFSFPYYDAPPRSKWLNDQFLENTGKGFVDVREKVGLPYKRNVGLSAAVGDVNNDGHADIYIANDFFGPDYFYINNGDKTFSDRRSEFFTKTPMSAMGSDFADIDNDGWLDLFVGEMMPGNHHRQKVNLVPFSLEIYNKLMKQGNHQYTRNMLQLNQDGKRFRDIGMLAGVHATEWSWSCFFFDADNDGLKDLYVANGILRDMTNMDFVKRNFGDDYTSMADPEAKAKANPADAPVFNSHNYMYRNKGNYDFQDKSGPWGMGQPVQTRGATYADLDGDGDLDVILNNMTEGPWIYENRSELLEDRNYLQIELQGKGQNTFGIGGKADLYYNGLFQSSYLSNKRGFQSCPEPLLHFGLGQHSLVDSIIVSWPGGDRELFKNIKTNQRIKLKFGEGEKVKTGDRNEKSPLLKAVKNGPQFDHKENPFDDFLMERLLIRKYSREGPGIAVADVNGDGRDDFFIGGAGGSAGKLFIQTPNGDFEASESQPWSHQPMSEDMGVVFFDANGDQAPDLFIASGSNEFAEKAAVLKDRLFINDGSGSFTLSKDALSSGLGNSSAVAVADFDKDGDQDIFVGGKMTPGNYSGISGSVLLINENGVFIDRTDELAPELKKAGLISSAIWSDADNDGDLDLLVVGEWLPLTIFYQEDGVFQKSIVPGSDGWWNSITGADIDSDGKMDYILGNHGLNSIFKASNEEPITLVISDFDNNGQKDPLVFRYNEGVNAPFVNRDIFTSQMPYFNNQYYSFKKYADVTYEDLVTEEVLQQADISYVRELRTSAFRNNGDGTFEKFPLPVEAQFAPVYGVLARDLTGDGNIDLLLCGNTYSNHYEYGSIDALGGLMLKGDGTFSFEAVGMGKSGFDLPNAPKSLVWLRHASGKPLILVGNNDGPLQSFQLEKEVKYIEMPHEATHAIIKFTDGREQRWEYYKGSGYLSQSGRFLLETGQWKEILFYQDGKLLDRKEG